MPPRSGLFFFDMLSADARVNAMRNIVATDRFHHSEEIKNAAAIAKSNLHQAINNRHHIPPLVRRSRHIRRIEREERYLIAYITQNFCEFDSDGRYRPILVHAVNLN